VEFDDFEFKPLTEGLGFHKKADKINSGLSAAATSGRSKKTDTRANRFEEELGASANRNSLNSEVENELLGRETARDGGRDGGRDSDRHAGQRSTTNISDLIASLPPSLDFIGGKEERSAKPMPSIEPNLSVPEGARPQIFQPFAREDFKAGISQTTPKATSKNQSHFAATPAPTVGAALSAATGALSAKLPQPGSKAITPPASATASGIAAKVPSAYRERLNESFARAFPHADRKGETNKSTAKETARETAKRKAMATQISGLEPVAANLGAGIIDAMVVTGMSSLLLVAIVGITHVNLYGLLTNVRTDGPTQVHLALLFLACLQLYSLTARSFFGASLGEWAFDLQLGSQDDQARAVYPLQVAWRTIFVTLTGLVVVPVLSLIFRRDLSRYVTGLQLYFRKA
jgi:hypothetical protein